jgi:hypothetical protein
MIEMVLTLGITWFTLCAIFLWLNYRFHRCLVSNGDRQEFTHQVSVERESGKSVTQASSENDVKIVSTNFSFSPKTGKITSPSGEVKLESYQRRKPAKATKRKPQDRDIGQG